MNMGAAKCLESLHGPEALLRQLLYPLNQSIQVSDANAVSLMRQLRQYHLF
jgi:hypothetical protein